jgi:hypothetical protein
VNDLLTLDLRAVRSAFFLMLAMMTFSTALHAQRAKVQVEFHIADTIYRSELGSEAANAEKLLQQVAITTLQKRIGFISFTADSSPNVIVVQLGDNPHSVSEPVYFHLRLASGLAHPQVKWVFRTQADITNPLSHKHSVQDKVHDVELVGTEMEGGSEPGEFGRRFSSISTDRLVNAVFRLIPVASQGVLKDGPPDPLWELPLNRTETCMDLESHLEVKHLLSSANRVPEELLLEVRAAGPPDGVVGPVQARVLDAPTHQLDINRLGAPGVNVTVTAVYVTRYEGPMCSPTVPPRNSGLTGGTVP